MSRPPVVLLVGHCRPDAFALKSAVRRALGEAEVVVVNSEEELASTLRGAALLLVNRALDGEFPDKTGVELIARNAANGVPAMLVSNFPDAQHAAEAAGARAGFGKRDLNSEQAAARMRAAIGAVG